MSCPDEIEICVIRGDQFELDVGLSDAFSEVAEDPTAYIGQLVFRELQDDALTPYLTLQSTVDVVEDALPGEYGLYLNFSATASQTQALPDWKIVAYCELRLAGNVANPQPKRLFNAEVKKGD